ncbi:MAG: hydroxymethylglutaryl-CoA lyase [Bdellovibrionota bacterium]
MNVTLVEVGLRDGLQNEKTMLPVDTRVEMAVRLANAGLRRIELGAYVHPKWVPQMAQTPEVVEKVLKLRRERKIPKELWFSVLVPNETGMTEALKQPVEEFALFASCTESFSKKNINCTIDESFNRFQVVANGAAKNNIPLRGYISVAFGCPFEGKVSEDQVVKIAQRLLDLGSFEISVGDTIGAASPGDVRSVFEKLLKVIPAEKLAGHFHDTRGQSLANTLEAYKMGIRVFDTSIGGLGGCPYAPGAAGNASTEDVAYMFEGMGVKTGIDLDQLVETNKWLAPQMDHPLYSKVGKVGRLKPLGAVN